MIELKDILRGLREQKQVSMDKMCEDLNCLYNVTLAKSTVSKWENGKAEPSLAYARILTKYFDVTLDYLLGLEKDEAYNFNILSKLETSLLENFNRLNTLGKEKLLGYSNDLIETPKYIADNVIDITATKEEPKTLQDLNPIILAAHDDDLTQDEKTEMDRRILKALNKQK